MIKVTLKYKPFNTYLNYLILFTTILLATTLSIFQSPHILDNACFTPHAHSVVIGTFNYYQNCDSPEFLKAGEGFPEYYQQSNERMSRPGYPILLKLASLVGFSGLIGAIIVNVLFGTLAVILFYRLIKNYFCEKISLLSSLLLVFSTHFHIFLGQAHTEIIGNFVIVASLYLLHLYIKQPTRKRLVIFSLIIGFLMLIKFVFGFAIFFLFLAIKYKRIFEWLIYLAISLIPTLCWYIYVRQVLGVEFVSAEVAQYHQGVWIFYALTNIHEWDDIVRSFIYSNGLLVIDSIQAFLYILVPLSMYGLVVWKTKIPKYFISISFIGSIAAMLFLMLWGGPRLAFSIFPLVLPLGVYGLFKLVDHFEIPKRAKPVIIGAVLAILMLSSLINTYSIIPSYDYNGIRCIAKTNYMPSWERTKCQTN